MNPIYAHHDEVYVMSFVVYANPADSKLYLESSFTNQAPVADVANAFKKNTLLIVKGTTSLLPVSMTNNMVSTVGTVTTGEEPDEVTSVVLVEWAAKAA